MSVYSRIFNKQYQSLMHPADRMRSDCLNPFCILLLCLIGVLFIYSAQYTNGGSDWKKQLLWVTMGFGLYAIVASVNYKIYLRFAHYLYAGGILGLLLATKISPMSVEMMGARRWVDIGITIVQPAEAAKVGTLIMAASILARSELGSFADSIVVLIKITAVFLLPMLLIFLQPDLGSSLVFPPMIFALLFISRLSEKFFLTAFALFAMAVAVLAVDIRGYSQHITQQRETAQSDASTIGQYKSILPIHNYQRDRILTFVAPDVVDPEGTGASWNAKQAKISAATGGATGKGLLKGTQAQLGYLPQAVAHNDFIFSVVAEEKAF